MAKRSDRQCSLYFLDGYQPEYLGPADTPSSYSIAITPRRSKNYRISTLTADQSEHELVSNNQLVEPEGAAKSVVNSTNGRGHGSQLSKII
jgi:hypothetical protein